MNFLGAFPQRVVNLHPALPGEFAGVRAIERAWQAGIDGGLARTGVMVHLVPDEQVDAGPVVATVEVAIVPGEGLEQLTERVHAAEHELLVDALATLCVPAPDPPR
jgi:phosphoribosylglycinamide formyltransferase-1